MKAVTITRSGKPDVLAVREYPDPKPGRGEVVIRVKAAGLNFAEVMARKGLYPDAPKPPCIVGYEVSGDVIGIGSEVRSVGIGDRVIALCHFGGHAEQVCVPESYVLAMPQEMSYEHAAALPVNYLTAHHILFEVASLKENQHVLVHMAAGGVGMAAIQLCRTVPGVTIYGTASASKHETLRAAGCNHPIDYRSTSYAAQVRKLTAGRGVDIVMDPLGGADWKTGYDLLAPAGILVAYGFANLAKQGGRNLVHVLGQVLRVPKFSPISLMDDNRSVSGVNMGHLWSEGPMLMTQMDRLLSLYSQGMIQPHIDRSYSFSRAAEAHRRLEERKNIGKVLLVPDEHGDETRRHV